MDPIPDAAALAGMTRDQLEDLWVKAFLEPPVVRASRAELLDVLGATLARGARPGACAPPPQSPVRALEAVLTPG